MNYSLEEILKIYNALQNGTLKKLEQHEVNPGLPKDSRENYLYFFLSCTINFRRSSPALWKSSLATWSDPETNYVFFPEKIIEESFENVQKAMVKHKLAIQTNKHPDIWLKISTTLNKHYQNDPRKLLEEGNYEIAKLIPLLQKEKKALFPYLSGIKLSNYTMAILNWYTDAQFNDMYNLSIVPDTHVIQSSVKLGIVEGKCFRS
jgi:hypothetical protein